MKLNTKKKTFENMVDRNHTAKIQPRPLSSNHKLTKLFVLTFAIVELMTLFENVNAYKISGNIYSLQSDDLEALRSSLMNTRILLNYGQFTGYPREDGTFEIDNLPSDSYVVEVLHLRYVYEPIRVDISNKGKMRARKVNYIQPSYVQQVNYPLRMNPIGLYRYFLPRETWRFMDLLMNPMVLMMAAPLLIIWLLAKMMNPADAMAQRDQMQIPNYDVPELSEMMTSMFGRQGQQVQGQQNQQLQGRQAIGPGSGGGNSMSGGSTGLSKQQKRR